MPALHIYCDGAARGNPGPAAIGAALYSAKGQLLEEISESIGRATNNVAEYRALVRALSCCYARQKEQAALFDLKIFMDSELVVRQMKREYRVKSSLLSPLFEEALKLCNHFKSCNFKHISREQNSIADRLANRALDRL